MRFLAVGEIRGRKNYVVARCGRRTDLEMGQEKL